MKKFSRGFTLIELLVVIAIIGILSAIVLASLSTARNKAQDAKIQGQLSSMRAAAEIYYGSQSPNSYGVAAACNVNMFNDTASGMKGLSTGLATTPTCTAANTTWVVTAPFASNANAFWCADSAGVSRQVNNATPVNGLCQ